MSKVPLCDSNKAALCNFDALPNASFVRAPVVAALRGCSVNTVWRHAKEGLIPKPKKIGPQVTAWNVGELRASLEAVV
jgi:predicted DNA-binding transcriptional regulator AlpA